MSDCIRPFQEADLPKLLEIDRACFEPGIAYDHFVLDFFIRRILSVTLVLMVDSDIAGFGIAAPERMRGKITGHIITLDLLPQARGKGYGRRLLQELESQLKKLGATDYGLEVDVRNAPAIAFYKKMSYRPARKLRNYYGPGKDAWKMVRSAV
ncbi:MAG TPA: GNAT family N-acetyltransferase [Acidobacteriota bacterium]|jgi:ribosomal-protein-alanine N-acetyltransferase